MDSNPTLPVGENLLHLHYDPTQRFQLNENSFNDNAFSRDHASKGFNKPRRNHEKLASFLQSQAINGLEMSVIDELSAKDLEYSDLASLTNADLVMMGFKHHQEREHLLQFFAQLPNQDLTFDEICHQPEAQKYNASILYNGSLHLQCMQHSLSEANYKLQIKVPKDVLVGEKYFASRFLTGMLEELLDETYDLEDEMQELSAMSNIKLKKSKKTSSHWFLPGLLTGLIALSMFWLMKKSQ